MAATRIAVFAGPSLPAADRVYRDGVSYLPPASRHDVLAVAKAFDAVLLIDGVFHHDLAPSPKECFASLECARMFGASSMGALRAAECAPYGFTPIGAIARWYALGRIDGEDEVAVLTHPQTHEALTVALVNVRYVARLAHRERLLSTREAQALVAHARTIFYMERSWEDVIEGAPVRARLDLLKLANAHDLKRMDARFALRRVLRLLQATPLRLPARVPKAEGTYDRAVPFAQTLELVPRLRERYGITRVADTTHLDRIGIPTYAAFVPQSPDLLGVYGGKGPTREAAMASAIMEATERQIAARVALPVFSESLATVRMRLDLESMGLREKVREDIVPCVWGTDMLSGECVAVPLAMVQCPWFGMALFDQTTSNGLASGNNLSEAVYHALCETIERHVWAIFHLRGSIVPRFFRGSDATDVAAAPELALPCGDASVDGLIATLTKAKLRVRVFILREPPLPPVALASITDLECDPPLAHMGLGCALSPSHAIVRALTEAVQSRSIDIQGAREDILREDEPAGPFTDHGRRRPGVPKNAWYYDVPARTIARDEIEDSASDDLAVDVKRTLEALRAYGIPTAVIVNLSPADLPVSVVRAIVPGLETFATTGRLGPHGRALLNPFVR